MGNTAGKETRSRNGDSSDNDAPWLGQTMSTGAFTREFLSYDESSNHNNHDGNKIFGNHKHRHHKKEKNLEKIKFKTVQINNLIIKYEENVDGGYLAPYGNYKYELDYITNIVKDLIINRKLSPFFTPLQDFDESWNDEELLKYLKNNLKLHEDIKPNDLNELFEDPNDHRLHQSANSVKRKEFKLFQKKLKEEAAEKQNLENHKFLKDFKNSQQSQFNNKRYPNIPSDDLLLRVYKNSQECPICFLYYPNMMNFTRCCIQPICTECFVQMKRLDPHFPHEEENGNNDINESNDENNDDENSNPENLISEPVKCPFCAVDNFGVTYKHPIDYKTGLNSECKPNDFKFIKNDKILESEELETSDKEDVVSDLTELDLVDPFSTKKERYEEKEKQKKEKDKGKDKDKEPKKEDNKKHQRNNSNNIAQTTRKRGASLPPDAPNVITIDAIRPDWEQKLLSARTKMARRSAAATALHATSLIGNTNVRMDSVGSSNAGHSGNGRYVSRQEQEGIEQRMIEEALRLSLLDEEERKMKEKMKHQRS